MAHLTFHEVLTAIRGGPKLARDNCERRLEHTCKNVNRRSGPSCRRIQQHPKKNDDNHHSRDDSPMIYRGQRPRGRPHRMRGLEGHCDKQHHENECTNEDHRRLDWRFAQAGLLCWSRCCRRRGIAGCHFRASSLLVPPALYPARFCFIFAPCGYDEPEILPMCAFRRLSIRS